MLVALCQLNSKVGDLVGNAARIRTWYRAAIERGADLVVFPELALTGYPPRDLLEMADFLPAVHETLTDLAAGTGETGLLLGTPAANPRPSGKPVFNAAVLLAGGAIRATVGKKLLPLYDVFDEARHFEADASPAEPVAFRGIRWGIHVCEDAWNEDGFWPRRLYDRDPVAELAAAGAEILVNISASPFHAKKIPLRRAIFESHSRKRNLPLLYTNAIGANDELIFDGEAYVFDAEGTLLASGRPFEEEVLLVEARPGTPATVHPRDSWNPETGSTPAPAVVRPELGEIESIHRALVLGLRDYAVKCGFRSAVLGLSGGVDSALTAALAAEALGPDQVWGIALPSRYSSPESLEDAETLAGNLGIHFRTVSIEPMFQAALTTLAPLFEGTEPGTAEENLQARIRGIILMGLSNKFGHLLLSTGNKSELAVGYCTLYGDMAGGLALISDVPKMTIYALARHLNRDRECIPERTLTRAPSAELRPDQTDQDSLPPYEVLDRILEGYIEGGSSVSRLEAEGLPPETIDQVVRLVTGAEYKRRQAAPGLKISPKAFGSGRRMPIASGWPPSRKA